MTAPDHRPYLLPTDLRTAEDVLAWLVDYAGTDPRMHLASVSCALRARLDRERRQACRRGALYAWREFRSWVHGWGYDPLGDGGECALEALARALAFRAAARAK